MIERLQTQAGMAVPVTEEARGRADATVEQVGAAGGALDTIVGAAATIGEMNVQIATAAQEHGQVAEDINRNVANIAMAAEQTAGSAGETAVATQGIGHEMGALNQRVRSFVVDEG